MARIRSAVVGAGTMGAGIALVFARAGYNAMLVDVSEKILEQAREKIRHSLDVFMKSKILSRTEANLTFSRLEFSSDLNDAVRDAEFVTEAIPEEIELKKQLFERLDDCAPPHAILASNTSGLSITEIASVAKRKDRIIGTNWWNPAHIIPLVELLKGKGTSDEVVARTRDVLTRIGKKPILVRKPISGFIGNRLQFALFREALSLLEKGIADAGDIDRAVRYGLGFRYPLLGPFAVADFGGLDVFYHISRDLNKDLDSSSEPSPTLARMVGDGRLGLKVGAGFYAYKGRPMQEFLNERDRGLLRLLKVIEEDNPNERGGIA